MHELTTTNELSDAFKILDKCNNGGVCDGSIDSSEFRTILKSLGQNFSPEEIDEMIKMADKDGDGSIDEKEFIAVMNAGSSKGASGDSSAPQSNRAQHKK